MTLLVVFKGVTLSGHPCTLSQSSRELDCTLTVSVMSFVCRPPRVALDPVCRLSLTLEKKSGVRNRKGLQIMFSNFVAGLNPSEVAR